MGCNNSKAVQITEPGSQDNAPKESVSNTPKTMERAKSKTIDQSQTAQQDGTAVKSMLEENDLVLGYWGVKGRAYPIRLLLNYVGVDFYDKCYTKETAKDWFGSDKTLLGEKAIINSPNLPFLIDNKKVVFESIAILKYLARKFNLCPEDSDLQAESMINMMLGIIKDDMDECFKAVFGDDAAKQAYKEKVIKEDSILCKLNEFLTQKKGAYVCGDKLYYIDILLLTMFELHEYIYDEKFIENDPVKYAGILEFREKMMKHEKIRKYVEERKDQPFFPN